MISQSERKQCSLQSIFTNCIQYNSDILLPTLWPMILEQTALNIENMSIAMQKRCSNGYHMNSFPSLFMKSVAHVEPHRGHWDGMKYCHLIFRWELSRFCSKLCNISEHFWAELQAFACLQILSIEENVKSGSSCTTLPLQLILSTIAYFFWLGQEKWSFLIPLL